MVTCKKLDRLTNNSEDKKNLHKHLHCKIYKSVYVSVMMSFKGLLERCL